MRVERRAPDVRPIDDVLHGQGFEPFLLNQGHQRRAQKLLRTLNASIHASRLPRALTLRTFRRRLFDIERTAAWRSAPPPLKVNIIFRNERPSIMNISLTTGGRGHGQRRRHETVRSWVARQRVRAGAGDHGQPRLRSPSRIGTRWIPISSSKPALRHCAARLAPKMITALPAAAAFAVATPSLTEPEMNVTAGWGFALGGRCVSTNTGPFHCPP